MLVSFRVLLLLIMGPWCCAWLQRIPSCKAPPRRRSSRLLPLPTTMREEVGSIVKRIVDHGRQHGGFSNIDPRELTENSHILTKSTLYEDAIRNLTMSSPATERNDIDAANAFIKGFVSSERKRRLKLKVNYILAGAHTKRLDQAISMLAESDEIDDDLINYVETLIKKEQQLVDGGLLGTIPDEAAGQMGSGKAQQQALQVLRMVRQRLMAEKRTDIKPEARLLALLLSERDAQARYEKLRKVLTHVEELTTFRDFLSAGISYLLQRDSHPRGHRRQEAREPPTADEDGVTTVLGPGDSDKGDDKEAMPPGESLPADTVERMKDLLLEVDVRMQQLRTGLRSGTDTFSSAAEDYAATQDGP